MEKSRGDLDDNRIMDMEEYLNLLHELPLPFRNLLEETRNLCPQSICTFLGELCTKNLLCGIFKSMGLM